MREDRFPELEWSPPVRTDIKEYLLVVEDADAPLPIAPYPGIYYDIPASTSHIHADDIKLDEADKKRRALKGGCKLGKNIGETMYGGSRPPLGHGPHRCFYQLVELKEPLDHSKMSGKATKKEWAAAIVGKVATWSVRIGVFENKKCNEQLDLTLFQFPRHRRTKQWELRCGVRQGLCH